MAYMRPLLLRLALILAATGFGITVGGIVPQVSQPIRSALVFAGLHAEERSAPIPATNASTSKASGRRRSENKGQQEGSNSSVKMSPAQLESAQIEIDAVGKGTLVRWLTVPGTVTPDAGRIARVPAKVVGTVAEKRKRLGDSVAKGEVVAVINSREVADAKSEFLTASVTLELQKTMFERAQILWNKRIAAEQQYLQARATYAEAELRADLARQKLSALGLDANDVAAAAKEDASKAGVSSLRTYDIRSPMSGRIVDRRVDVGAPVGKEGDASELYTVADLSAVWVELAVPTADLDLIKEGQRVAIRNGPDTGKRGEGKIVFITPILNQDTRSARVIAAVDNNKLSWRPGSFVTANITIDEQSIDLRVPRRSLQTIGGKQVVFVRTTDGFEKREVALGEGDDQAVDVVSGLCPGEKIAVGNTFLLKAELGKTEPERSR
jgi:cobalt-zinc-cadmium efflux system membrane fusion protein